jgi:hypothetical protein
MLTPIADDLWGLDHELRLLAGSLRLPVRMTVIRLLNGTLALHSPVPLDDAAAAELRALGEVAHILAPSKLHHLWVAAAAERYPRAKVWRSPEIPRISDALEPLFIAGVPKIDETVFFHAPSRTLVCSDLVFNITHHANLRTKLLLKITDVGGKRLAVSREWNWATKDRAARDASVEQLLAWDIARIVPGHGDVWEGDGRAALHASRLARGLAR